MKTYLQTAALAIGFILFLFAETNVTAQEHWAKDQTNPVFKEFGTWAKDGVLSPSVIFEDNLFKMWYSAKGCSGQVIGYAQSVDGIKWQPSKAPLFPFGIVGVWDEDRDHPCVIRVNDTLKMWFSGSSDNFIQEISIGYAWSVDNKTWFTCSMPVLEKGEPGSWDERTVYKPSVYFDGEIYHMWYNGCQGTYQTEPVQIGYAKSNDGIHWVKNTICNPVITVGEPGTFYDTWIQSSCVMFKDDEYKMWFTGWDQKSTTPRNKYIRIGYATSPNYTNWSVQNDNLPVADVGFLNSWDLYSVESPSVLFHDGQYKMWFSGYDGYIYRIGYAAGFQAVEVPGDFSTIEGGITAASDGEVVLVGEGTYYENIDFQGKAITIASKYLLDGDDYYIDNTIIDGSQSKDSEKSSVVYFVSGEDTNSVLKGFTITGGSGTQLLLGQNVTYGGGIFCSGSSAKIEHNKIINNYCIGSGYALGGGGIYADNYKGGLTIIRHNLISGNYVINSNAKQSFVFGGGLSIDNDAIIMDNIITDNFIYHLYNGIAEGGGIAVRNNKAIITNNIISKNLIKESGDSYWHWGGGVFGLELKQGSIITGNTILDNKIVGSKGKGGGIGLWRTGDIIKIDKNIINNNYAKDGGGIAVVFNQKTTITNNVIMNNHSKAYGGGIYLYQLQKGDKSYSSYNGTSNTENYANNHDGLLCVIANNTIYNNKSDGFGGGISAYWIKNYFLAFNNIIYNNTSQYKGDAIYLSYDAKAYLFHNVINEDDIYGTSNWIGDGSNISVNPEIIDEMGHLSWISPCVNAGVTKVNINNIMYSTTQTDIDGEVRPYLNTIPDIGADETNSIHVQVAENKFTNQTELLAFPNPFSEKIDFSFSVFDNSFVSFTIVDSQGKLIKTLMNEMRTAGDYQFSLDGTTLPPGIYLGVLRTTTKTQTTKFIKLR